MARKILDKKQTKELILESINRMADLVGSTLGPGGSVVIIQDDFCVKPTKDGVSVAKEIGQNDIVSHLFKQAAEQTLISAGDGTTSSTVLARELIVNGFNSNEHPAKLKKGMENCLKELLKKVEGLSVPADDPKVLKQVCLISSNSEQEITDIISEALDIAGVDGAISYSLSNEETTRIVKTPGYEVQSGFASTHFINTPAGDKCVLENPLVWILPVSFNHQETVMEALGTIQKIVSENPDRPLVIVADDINKLLPTLVNAKLNMGVKICAVSLQGSDIFREQEMLDLCAITGCMYRNKEEFKTLTPLVSELGTIERFESTPQKTTFIGNYYDKVKDRVSVIENQIENLTNEYLIGRQRERIQKLKGRVVNILVGGVTEMAATERKDRIDDALCAVKAAVKKGVVPGAGAALLFASKSVRIPQNISAGEQEGWKLLLKACEKPAWLIANNAGASGDYVVSKTLEMSTKNKIIGYDASEDKFVLLLQNGIIDPFVVTESVLKNAVSVAGQLLTSSGIVEKEINKDEK